MVWFGIYDFPSRRGDFQVNQPLVFRGVAGKSTMNIEGMYLFFGRRMYVLDNPFVLGFSIHYPTKTKPGMYG